MEHFKESNTKYTNKRMWRADIGNFQFEAIQKGGGIIRSWERVRVDIYEYHTNLDKKLTGSFIESLKFDTIELADLFMGHYSILDFSLGLQRIRENKCPVCGNADIHSHNLSHLENMNCYFCKAFWTVHYKLTGYGNMGHDSHNAEDVMDVMDETVRVKKNISAIDKWPEIIQAVLEQKKMLPALLGIDDELDKLIAERLKDG